MEEQKKIIDSAQADWNQQCKSFMLHKIPSKDKTMKACLKRHGFKK